MFYGSENERMWRWGRMSTFLDHLQIVIFSLGCSWDLREYHSHTSKIGQG